MCAANVPLAVLGSGTTGAVRSESGRRAAAAAVLLPAAVMLALGLWGLDRGTMWRDEAATFQVARRPLPDLWHTLGGVDAVHGLYYLLMHVLLGIRADEVMLRLPSLLAAVCTAGLVGAIGTRLARPRVGLWAGLLYAATPFAGHYAQEGRSYALVAAGAALTTLLLVRAVADGSALRWTAYGAVTAVTALLHEFALLTLVAHALTLSAPGVPWRARRCWAAAAGAASAALLPLLALSRRQEGQVSWIAAPGRPEAEHLIRDFAGPSGAVFTVVVVLLVTAVLRPPPRTGTLSLRAVALPLAVLPPVLLFAFSRWQQPLFVDRYVLFSLAGVPLLAAAGAEGLVRLVRPLRRADWQRPVTLAGVAAIAVSFLWQFPLHERERRPTSRHDDLGQVAALVGAAVPPGEWVLFVPSYQRRVALAYPRHFAGLHDLALREPVSRSGTLNGRDVRPAVVRARLARLDRVWVVAVPGIERAPWFRANHGEQDKLAALRENFTGVATVAVRSGTVTRYERPRPGPGPVADRTGATTRPYPHRPGPVTLPAGSRQWPPSKKSVVSSCSLP